MMRNSCNGQIHEAHLVGDATLNTTFLASLMIFYVDLGCLNPFLSHQLAVVEV